MWRGMCMCMRPRLLDLCGVRWLAAICAAISAAISAATSAGLASGLAVSCPARVPSGGAHHPFPPAPRRDPHEIRTRSARRRVQGATLARDDARHPSHAHVQVPDVYWEATNERVLTMEFVESFKLTDLARVEAEGLDKEKLSGYVAESFLTQILKTGYFHCDPHPGNLCVNKEGKLVFYDCGAWHVHVSSEMCM